MAEPFLAMITPLTGSGGGPVDPGWSGGVAPPGGPAHPIVIPPEAIGPGVPAHPIYLPVYPSHPIVIPPDGLAPGVPTHPIYLPVYPGHPIVLPPDAVGPGLPTHPIVLPPVYPAHPIAPGGAGSVDPGYGISSDRPTHPIVIPPEAIVPGQDGTAQVVVYYGGQRMTFTVEVKPPGVPTQPAPKPA